MNVVVIVLMCNTFLAMLNAWHDNAKFAANQALLTHHPAFRYGATQNHC